MIRKLLMVFALLAFPAASHALQLHWASGSSDISFNAAARCTLIVETDPSEGVLPAEWRLVWVAGHCSNISIVSDSMLTDTDRAQVLTVAPQTPLELAGNVTTAVFHGLDPSRATMARWVLDLPAGAVGQFQVVTGSIGPSNASPLLTTRSPLANFNGGIRAPFAPVMIAAWSSRSSSRLTVTALGAGLDHPASATVLVPETNTRIPLDILEHTDTSITATALIPEHLTNVLLEFRDSTNPLDLATPIKADSLLILSHPPERLHSAHTPVVQGD